MRPTPVLAALLLIAAAPAPIAGSQRDAIIAEAASIPPETLDFDRASNAVRRGGGTTTTTTSVDRWNGKAWTLVSIGGKTPTREQRQSHARAVSAVPVPGYHRVAALLAAATSSRTDGNGRTIWQIPVLPAGTVFTDSGDISSHLKAEARVARRGDRVWIDQVHITEREAFKMNMLIKVTGFSQTLDYEIGSDGTPRQVAQASESTGSMFGFPGGENALVTFTYR
jgi:hypothetical protein